MDFDTCQVNYILQKAWNYNGTRGVIGRKFLLC